jgi:formyl-CoA transferase/CoA:oxalate CoA-transferase
MLLGDLGADVIKIESPRSGDIYRRQGPHYIEGESTAFLSLNRNKKSLTLNLKSPQALEVIRRLLPNIDGIVENSRPGSMEKLGLGYKNLRLLNPRIIYVSISAFGQTGPLSREGGYDLILQAFTGLMHLTGEPGGRPNKIPIAALDFGAGMLGVVGMLSACIARHRTGQGQYVDTSLLDCAVSWLGMHLLDYSATGELPRALGSASPFFAPYQAFRTADGYIVIVGTGSGDTWPRLCRALGVENLVDQPDFATNAARVQNRGLLVEALEKALVQRDSEFWLRHLKSAGIVCGPIRTLDALLQDEQVQHRQLMQRVKHSVAGQLQMAGAPLGLSATPAAITTPPPELGAHTRDILCSLGYRPDDIATLHAEGVI